MNNSFDLQNIGLLLLLSFCAALIIVGIILLTTRMWDRKSDRDSHEKTSGSKKAGRLMVISGSLVGFVTLIFFVVNLIGGSQ